jgi:hypothetical protein
MLEMGFRTYSNCTTRKFNTVAIMGTIIIFPLKLTTSRNDFND